MEHIDKLAPNVTIELGGETRKLEFTLHSICQYQLLTGKNLFRGELDTTDPREIAALVWVGLISNDESLDGTINANSEPDETIRTALRQISKWITFPRIGEIASAIQLAFNQAAPVKKKG